MPGIVGGEKEGMQIALAVARGELQRQLAKVGQRTFLRAWKQRLVLTELCSRLQHDLQDRTGQKEMRVHGAWESSHTAPQGRKGVERSNKFCTPG